MEVPECTQCTSCQELICEEIFILKLSSHFCAFEKTFPGELSSGKLSHFDTFSPGGNRSGGNCPSLV